MEADAGQARELKILSDILALALDEQAGVSVSALEALKQRARQAGVSGGALKEVFLKAQSVTPAAPRDDGAMARARARLEELQSQVVVVEQMRRQDLATIAGALRRARLAGLLAGLLMGAGLAVVGMMLS